MTPTTTLRRVAPAGLLAATLLLPGCGSSSSSNDGGREPMSTPAPSSTSSASASPSAAGASATPAFGPHNDADVMFASMMIPHHQQAVEMSDVLLAKTGIDPNVTKLATGIKQAQSSEIAQMSGWLAGWGQNPSPSMDEMDGMDHGGMEGTMSQGDMDALDKANGGEAQKLFLTGMITHHQGAVQMAKTELNDGTNLDAKQLAQQIITSQNTEIDQMNQLLGR